METKAPVTTAKPTSLQNYTPERISTELRHIRTVGQAIAVSGEYPTLATLRREHGTKAEIIIKLYLTELSELVNLKRSLTDRMQDVIARQILNSYYTLTIADIHVVFTRAITGEWGDYYESLDVPKVLRWFASYFDERCSLAEQQSQNTAYYDKGGNITSERMKKHFENLTKKTKRL